ncbi:hypothetical protein ES708_22158 [subsurface metagenome]
MDRISTIILASSLIIIMLGMGLSLVFDDFKRIIIYPKAIFVGLTNQLIILPLNCEAFLFRSKEPIFPDER